MFHPFLYELTFLESGLPEFSDWSIDLDGVNESSTATEIVFGASNGSQSYTIGAPHGFTSAGPSTTTVRGADLTVGVAFSETFLVTFGETGLPGGTRWNVTLEGVERGAATDMIVFTETNATYGYSVALVAGYAASPASGVVVVNGANQGEGIVFLLAVPPSTYTVTFLESGLPVGTVWSVTLNGATNATTGGIAFVGLANGTYPFAVGTVAGYLASPSGGTVTVDGVSAVTSIAFAAIPPTRPTSNGTPPATFLGLPALEGYSVLVGIVAVIVAGALRAVRGRRARRTPPPGRPPPSRLVGAMPAALRHLPGR